MGKRKGKAGHYLVAVALVAALALGTFAGHWWALRKPMVCACYSQCIMPELQLN